jgi:sialidase-1
MAVEALDGRVYLTVRNQDFRTGRRAYAWSEDGGVTWSPLRLAPALPDPACQGSIVRYSGEGHDEPGGVLFANPAVENRTGKPAEGRQRLTIRLSEDECRTWSAGRVVHPGPAAYSDLCVLGDKTILCLHEGGDSHWRQWMRLARLDLAWLTA